MTVAYAMSDLAPGELIDAGTVSVPTDRGGCGHEHHVKINEDRRPYIDCKPCSEYLIAGHYGWANTPSGVPLTCDEQGEVEISKRDGETSYRLAMKAMGDAVGQIVQGNRAASQQPAPVSLKAQLAALSAEEKAELAAILTAPTGPPVKPVQAEVEKPTAKRATATARKPAGA